jgi:NAD(P)H-hydrate epimerase
MPPILTRDQLRRVDELAASRYGIPSLILMENAGRSAASIIDAAYGPKGRTFVVCGSGNNGGDGCVIARHLHNHGWEVRLMIIAPFESCTLDTGANLGIIEALGLRPIIALEAASQQSAAKSIEPGDVVVDALLGTGFRGEVRPPLNQLIDEINAACKRATVAVDVPSGLDCDTGQPSRATIRADLTVTFVAMKRGFTFPRAAPFLGRIEVADIAAPPALIDEVAGPSS